MANGKFSNPRNPNSEELEIEEAFRRVMGEDIPDDFSANSDDIFSTSSALQEDDLLADLMLEELLREEATPEPAQTKVLPPLQEEWNVSKEPMSEPEPEEVPEEPVSTPVITKNRKIVLITLISLALVVVIGIGVTVAFLFGGDLTDDGLILNNVTVAGVNLGGMTREEAVKALHAATDLTYTSKDMVVILPNTTLYFSPTQTGASLDVEAAVEAAYEYGRTGSLSEQRAAKEKIQSGVYQIGLLPYLSLNTTYIRQQLDEYGAAFNSTYCDASYSVTGTMPTLEGEEFDIEAPCQTLLLNAGSPGRHLDINAVYNQVLDAYSFNKFEVDASQAAPEETPEALDLQAIWEELYLEPVDATMDMETFEINPETYGYGFDLELAVQMLSEAEPGTEVSVPMEYVVPENTAETLGAVLFRDELSYAETPHTNNENRNNNLRLACASINNLVLMPGEVFNYNDALGKRTAEAGYKAAPAYSGGETVQELGGGICQVSSTLYYAALLADMEIVTRSAHSYVSSYISYGMDATVSWGGPEFEFANNTNYPIRIEAEVSDGYVKIRIVGTDEKDYYVKMEYNIISIKSYETIYEDYPVGNEKGYKDGDIIVTPYTGYTVETYRCKYSKETDELLSREYEDISRYKSRDLVIARVGAEETEEPTEAPTDTPTEPPTETTPPTEPPTEASTEPPAETTPPTEAPADGEE